MRPVKILKYEKKEGKTVYDIVDDGRTGIFLQFGINYEDLIDGCGNFTTAIIELPDGKVINHPVELIQFMDKG